MDLRQLQYFVRVAEQRSFSNAAALLDVSQSAVSRRVRLLEVELKANLFRRNGRGVQLTPQGRGLLEHARGILRSAEAARVVVGQGAARRAGRVVIGLPPSIGQMIIPLFVARFAKRFPQAALSVVQGLSDGLCEQVLTGRLDFAVVRNPSASSQLTIELIGNEHLCLLGAQCVGRPGDHVSLSDIARLPLIMPNAPDATRPVIEAAMARRGLIPHLICEIDSVPSIIELVAVGFGYSIVPASIELVVPPERRLHLQRIDAPEFSAALCFVASARPQTDLMSETVQLARGVVAEVLGSRLADRRL